MVFDQKAFLALAGWALAAAVSVALVVQFKKTQVMQTQWQQQAEEQQERIVELELIIAELHLDRDESGPTINDAASKTGSAISNVLQRVRERFSRDDQ